MRSSTSCMLPFGSLLLPPSLEVRGRTGWISTWRRFSLACQVVKRCIKDSVAKARGHMASFTCSPSIEFSVGLCRLKISHISLTRRSRTFHTQSEQIRKTEQTPPNTSDQLCVADGFLGLLMRHCSWERLRCTLELNADVCVCVCVRVHSILVKKRTVIPHSEFSVYTTWPT